jgi:cell division control protein 6
MISILAVSQKLIFSMLEESVVSTFRRTNTVELANYDREQLSDLLTARVELAYRPGAVEDGVVDLLADIAASEGGDARFAIELLHTAGQVAEEAGADTVTPENARAAKAHIKSFVDEVRLSGLDVQKKIVLLAIARCLGRKAYTTTGEVEECYALACEEYSQKPRAHTQFWNYLKDLDAQSLIDAKRSSEGMVGTTTVISLPDIPAAVLEEKLVAMLSRDRS